MNEAEFTQTDVLVIGAGPVGLTLAGLLARHGITSVVVERRSGTITSPAAHVLRNGPRAVLGLLGVDDAISQAVPELPMHFVTWCTTLAGSELGRIDLRGSTPTERPWTNLSQSLLEPILSRAVEQTGMVTLLYGAECVRVSGHDPVSAESDAEAVVRLADGTERIIRSQWIVAADGAGSRTRAAIGAELVGDGPLGRFFMVHFRADLTRWIADRPGPIFWIMNPEASGTLIVHDAQRSHVFMSVAKGHDDEEKEIPARLAAALGERVDAPIEITTIDTWVPFCQVVDNYRRGRVLLLGDAAHRFPPSGGLGLNTGIMEAHNLAWKLAFAINGTASDTLLDSYDAECRPAATKNANISLQNALDLLLIYDAIGPCIDLEELEARLSSMTPDERAILDESVQHQRSHFLFDGYLPQPAAPQPNEPHCPTLDRWTDSLAFTLHLVDSGRVHTHVSDASVGSIVDTIHQTTRVPMHWERVAQSTARDGVVMFVTRPDGITLWSLDRPELAQELPGDHAIATAIVARMTQLLGTPSR